MHSETVNILTDEMLKTMCDECLEQYKNDSYGIACTAYMGRAYEPNELSAASQIGPINLTTILQEDMLYMHITNIDTMEEDLYHYRYNLYKGELVSNTFDSVESIIPFRNEIQLLFRLGIFDDDLRRD